MRITVEYFAIFREQAGRDSETIDTDEPTAAGLYAQLAHRHGFGLEPERLRVAINDTFEQWSAALRDGDRIVFIPPVAGG